MWIVGNRGRGETFSEVFQLKPPSEKGRAPMSILQTVDEEDVAMAGRRRRPRKRRTLSDQRSNGRTGSRDSLSSFLDLLV